MPLTDTRDLFAKALKGKYALKDSNLVLNSTNARPFQLTSPGNFTIPVTLTGPDIEDKKDASVFAELSYRF